MWCHEKGEVCYGCMVVYSSVFKIIGLMWFPVGVSGAVYVMVKVCWDVV